MLSRTRRGKIVFVLLIAAGIAVVGLAGYQVWQRILFERLSPTEKRIVGAWSWTYIEGVGRMIFSADHRVKEGFPPDDPEKPAVHDRDFTYLSSGTWHVEGDILVTDITNQPLIDGWRSGLDTPKFDRKVRRRWSERRTAVRPTLEMISTPPLRATRVLVRRRSSCSR